MYFRVKEKCAKIEMCNFKPKVRTVAIEKGSQKHTYSTSSDVENQLAANFKL